VISVEEFIKLQERAEQLRHDKARAAGALEEVRKRLRAEFGCKTTAEAKELLRKLDGEIASLECRYRAAEKEIQNEWEDKLP
jgi:predicted Zn-dependent protease